jgi:DNA-binding MarR family transcriptional regulator
MENTIAVSTIDRASEQRDHVDRWLEELDPFPPDLDLTVEGIVDRIMGLSRRIRRTMDETLSEFDLSWGEWKLLGSLRAAKPARRLSAGELSRKHELTTGAMTSRLDKLEQAGFVRRQPNPDDRRGVLVELTDAGLKAWEQAVGVQAEKESLIARAALDRTQLDELNRHLRRLMIAFEQIESGAEEC